MPTYLYRCPGCGHQFEKFHKITAKARAKCPACGRPAERVITGGAGLLFKGSGFYITDYKRGGSQGAEGKKGESGDKGPEGSKADQPAPKKTGDDH